MKLRVFCLFMLVAWLAACADAAPAIPPAATATIAPTAVLPPPPPQPTNLPTNTPINTPTNTPTNAPIRAPTLQATATPARSGFNLRAVDWQKVIMTDAKLTYEPKLDPPPGDMRGPHVMLKSNNVIYGYALLGERILYLDMSGDGQEEAVISLFSGGTAGNTGALIYATIANTPTLVDTLAGYKFGAVAEGNVLVARTPIYAGWEPNCCYSGTLEERLRLKNNKLESISIKDYGLPEARAQVVEHFYALLNQKKFDEAWGMLSASFKSGRSFNEWKDGYASTQTIQVEAQTAADGVSVTITATDKTATDTVTKKYKGTWTLTWFSNARTKLWLLDKASIAEVK